MAGLEQQRPALAPTPIEDAELSVAPWFPIPYEEQLERKQTMLRHVLGRRFESIIQPMRPSPQIVGHRNKMEFSFGYDDDERPALGFHQRGKFWRVKDLTRSVLLTEAANRVYADVKRWATDMGLPFYRQVDNRGFFRFLVIREGKRTGEILVKVVVNPAGFEGALDRVKSELTALARSNAAITSLWLTYRQSVGDAATGEQSELLAGSPLIHERLLGLTFQISPDSFFQVNTDGAEKMYQRLRQLLEEIAARQTVLDLYCGSGGIALTLSHQAGQVIGIDSDAESIRLAVENAKINRIENSRFICAGAKQAPKLVSPPVDVLVVDPPRAGLAPKTIRSLLRLAPRYLFYLSCNPKGFRDNARMMRRQLRVEQIIPLDLFPHTPHIELIATMTATQ